MRPGDKSLKPQDIILALKLVAHKDAPQKVLELAYELGISQSQVSYGLERLKRSGLLSEDRKVMKRALLEFLIYGLKYVYPAKPGPLVRGMLTAHSAKPLAGKIVSDEPYVWPTNDGDVRGVAIEPLYVSAPKAAKNDQALYELLALVDAIRVGRAREQAMAKEELKDRLGA
jgi:DNA-binding Lrp family transcriptional regulator